MAGEGRSGLDNQGSRDRPLPWRAVPRSTAGSGRGEQAFPPLDHAQAPRHTGLFLGGTASRLAGRPPYPPPHAAIDREREHRESNTLPVPSSLKKRSLMPSGPLRKRLRAAGHHLSPIVYVGKDGVTDPVLRHLAQALRDHELVKVKIGTESPEDRFEASNRLGAGAEALQAQILGRTLLLYKKHPEKPRFEAKPAPLGGVAPAPGDAARVKPRPRPSPEGGGKKPRSRSNRPDGVDKKPRSRSGRPEGGEKKPRSRSGRPEGGEKKPRSRSGRPEGGGKKPWSRAGRPGGGGRKAGLRRPRRG